MSPSTSLTADFQESGSCPSTSDSGDDAGRRRLRGFSECADMLRSSMEAARLVERDSFPAAETVPGTEEAACSGQCPEHAQHSCKKCAIDSFTEARLTRYSRH